MRFELGVSKVQALWCTKEHQDFITLCLYKKSCSTIQLLLVLWSCYFTAENILLSTMSYLKETLAHWAFQEELGLGFCQFTLWKVQAFSFLFFTTLKSLEISYTFLLVCQHLRQDFFTVTSSQPVGSHSLCFKPTSPKLTVRFWLVIVHSEFAIHHCVDWVPMSVNSWDNVPFFTKPTVNIWSVSSI